MGYTMGLVKTVSGEELFQGFLTTKKNAEKIN
jgi:hypothetical protein